jgi:hypothetical protein
MWMLAAANRPLTAQEKAYVWQYNQQHIDPSSADDDEDDGDKVEDSDWKNVGEEMASEWEALPDVSSLHLDLLSFDDDQIEESKERTDTETGTQVMDIVDVFANPFNDDIGEFASSSRHCHIPSRQPPPVPPRLPDEVLYRANRHTDPVPSGQPTQLHAMDTPIRTSLGSSSLALKSSLSGKGFARDAPTTSYHPQDVGSHQQASESVPRSLQLDTNLVQSFLAAITPSKPKKLEQDEHHRRQCSSATADSAGTRDDYPCVKAPSIPYSAASELQDTATLQPSNAGILPFVVTEARFHQQAEQEGYQYIHAQPDTRPTRQRKPSVVPPSSDPTVEVTFIGNQRVVRKKKVTSESP